MGILIRSITMQDLNRISEIESICFPSAEAAPKASIAERIEAFGELFFVAETRNNTTIGFIDGCATNSPVIYDEMFHDTKNHVPNGDNLAIFGLDVIPEYRNQGIGGMLMKHFIFVAKQQGRKAVILTCKDKLIHYYETFGYVNNGASLSTHGGAEWFDMTLQL